MNPIRRNIPNAITCINVLSGCIAITFALQGDTLAGSLKAYQWAYIFIGIAAVADFCDGFSARLLHAYSAMGKELDSLSDLVSFGVAPAMLLFQALKHSGAPLWLPWTTLIIPVCGALRLAKFNIDSRQTTSFSGLPIPANALFWIGFTSLCYRLPHTVANPMIIVPAIALLSWLMVSEVNMFSLKFTSFGWKGNGRRWTLIICAILLITSFGTESFMWIIVFYIALSMIPPYKNNCNI